MKSILLAALGFLLGCLLLDPAEEIKVPLDGAALINDPGYNALKVGKEGRIYIADRYNYRIKIFSPRGKYVSEFGSRGEGPGQFKRWFGEYTIGMDNNVYQLDFWGGNRCISIFNPEGEYIKRIPIKLNGNFGPARIFTLDTHNYLIICSRGQTLKRVSNLVFMGSGLYYYRVNAEGGVIKEYFNHSEFYDFSYTEGKGWPAIPYRVSVISEYNPQSGIIAHQKSNDDFIHFYDIQKGTRFKFKNGFKKQPVTKKDLEDWVDKYVRKNPRRRDMLPYYLALLKYGKTIENFKPIMNRLFFDPDGNLHVTFYDGETGINTVNVISPKTGLIKTYSAKELPSYFYKGKKYFISFDEEEDLYYIRISSR